MSTKIPLEAEKSNNNKSEKTADSKTENLTRQGGVVAGMTFLSRISGLMRDILLSYLFGASAVADMFFVAFRIPNFFRRMFAEGAFSQAFVPVLMRYKDKGRQELHYFLAALSGLFGLVLFVVVCLGVVFASGLTALFAPGFLQQPEKFSLTTDLVRITFPYLGFISLTAFAGSLLNAHSRFALPAFTPVMLNLCLMVAAMLALSGWFDVQPVILVAWGVMAAGILQLGMQLPALSRMGLLIRPRLSTQHTGVRKVGVLLIPALLAASVTQINALVNTILASTLTSGSIAWLYYADRLLELPIGLVAVALGTVMLPHLSTMVTRGDSESFQATISWGISLGLMLSLPAAVAMYFFAQPLLAVIFMSIPGGAMTASDIFMASYALEMFAIALPGFVLVKVLSPAYFAHQDLRTPFKFAVFAVVVNLSVGLATFQTMGHKGLAMATAISAWTHAILLYVGLHQNGHYRFGRIVAVSAAKTVFASAVLGLGLLYLPPSSESWMEMQPVARLGGTTLVMTLGLLGYLVVLLLMGIRPKDFEHQIKRG
jgi:putative peptidoglycan lipid II flippase